MTSCSDNISGNYSDYIPKKFSSDSFHAKLDNLLNLYSEDVSQSMLPGISEDEIKEKCSWFPGEIPEEIISLYSWRAGQFQDQDTEDFFWFRDNIFHELESARFEYESIMKFYGSDPKKHEFLKYSFPFAAHNGGFYIIPTKNHPFDKYVEKPIISIFEGIDLFFYSIETMVDTCIEWVSHPLYFSNLGLPHSIERKIWEKHNPGVFLF